MHAYIPIFGRNISPNRLPDEGQAVPCSHDVLPEDAVSREINPHLAHTTWSYLVMVTIYYRL